MTSEKTTDIAMTREHLFVLAKAVDAVRDEVVQEWLPEAVQTMLEGGWTKGEFSVEELETEARYLLSTLAERLRYVPYAPQTVAEKRAFRLLGGSALAGGNEGSRLVCVYRLPSSLTQCVWVAILTRPSCNCPRSLAVKARVTLTGAVREAIGWCTSQSKAEGRWRNHEA